MNRYGISVPMIWELRNGDPTPFVRPRSSFEVCGNNAVFNSEIRFYAASLALALPALYGATHFLGWNVQFPSSTERCLWRIAAIGITVSGLIIVLAVFAWFLYSLKAFNNIRNARAVVEFIRGLIVQFVPVLYMICSLYLVVESFQQLYFLPPDAYELPSFSNFLPHFT